MSLKSTSRIALIAAAVAAVAVSTTGIAQAADQGVSKTEIVLGTTVPLTGPAAPGYKDIAPASAAYFDYVNKNGGINGRKVRLVIKDDQYNPASTVTATNELILNDKIFALFGALGTSQHSAVIDTLKSQNVPDLFPNTGDSAFDNVYLYPKTFPYFPSYVVEAKAMAYYIANTPTLASKKACFFYQEGDFGGNAALGFKAAGLNFAEQASYVSGSQVQPFAAQVVKLKTAGCELVAFFGVPSATANMLGTAAKVAFNPTWMVSSVGSEPTILNGLLGASSKALMNKMYTPSFLTPTSDVGNPYVKQMKAIAEGAGLQWNFFTYYGINTAYVTAQALKAAGPNLTRTGLVNVLQSKSLTFKSAASVPFLYAKNSHQGLTGYWMGQYDADGNLGRITDYVMLATSNQTGQAKKATFKQLAAPKMLLP